MMAIIGDGALAVGESFAAGLLVKATLTLAVSLIGYRLARRSRAAVRHVLLAAAFGVLLVLPVASSVIPARGVEVMPPAGPRATPAAIVPLMPDSPRSRMGPSPSVGSQPIASSRFPLSRLLTVTWALGALTLFVPVLVGLSQARALRRSGASYRRGTALADALWQREGPRRRVDVLLHGSVSGPMTYGILRPKILLPPDVDMWSDDELRRALIHELEHVRRGDWATLCLARAVCAAYWFHPLVWMAWNRLRLEAERACDDAVLQDADSTAYAHQLVGLAERLSTAGTQPLLAMAARRDLSTRVRAVLDAAQQRGRAGAVCVATAVVAAALLVTAVAPLRAVPQAEAPAVGTQDPPLAFDTASVKRNKSGIVDEQFIQRDPRGNLRVVNMPLRQLIVFAYQIQGFQLQGTPDWSTSERFDIEAKPEKELPMVALPAGGPDPMRLMLRTLLADRFKLVVHKETKELPIFELVLARQDGRLGPQLRRSTTDCSGGAPKPLPAGPGGCGITRNSGRIRFGGFPLSAFANTLSQPMQRVVVDRTGLTGNWDFELAFTPDQSQLPPGTPPGQLPDVDPNAPSLVTAIEEQLGLRLRAARGPVEVLVVDRVDRPTEN